MRYCSEWCGLDMSRSKDFLACELLLFLAHNHFAIVAEVTVAICRYDDAVFNAGRQGRMAYRMVHLLFFLLAGGARGFSTALFHCVSLRSSCAFCTDRKPDGFIKHALQIPLR